MGRKVKDKGKKGSIVAIAVIVALALFTIWWVKRPVSGELQEALANSLGISSEYLSVNIPPLSDRLPGSIMVQLPDKRWVVRRVGSLGVPGTPVNISGSFKLSMTATAQLTSMLGLKGSSNAGIEGKVKLGKVSAYEMLFDDAFKRSLSEDETIVVLAKKKSTALVNKVYLGTLQITLTRTGNTSAEAWKKLKENQQTSGSVSVDGENSLTISSEGPIAFAYETVSLQHLASSLGTSKTDWQTKPLALDSVATNTIGANSSKVGVAVAGEEVYASSAFGDLPSVEPSLELVAETLAGYSTSIPTTLASSTRLSRSDILQWVTESFQFAKAHQLEAVVLYWIGHSVSSPDGKFYLVMGNYRGSVSETKSFLAGGGKPREGLVDLAEIYDVANAAKIPFAFFLDGCYENKPLQDLRENLGFTANGDSVGTQPDEMENFRQLFSASHRPGYPFLTGPNPVIFAAIPGTLAETVPHPYLSWPVPKTVGPLARKLFQSYSSVDVSDPDTTWATLIRRSADQVGLTGEMRLNGTITFQQPEGFHRFVLVP